MRKRVKRLIAVGLGAVAVTATTQQPAAAGYDLKNRTALNMWPSCYISGYGTFSAAGETMLVQDVCEDGRAIRVRWSYWNGYTMSDWNYIHYKGGSDNPMGRTYELDQPKDNDDNLPEDLEFCFQVGLEDDGEFTRGSYGPEVCGWT